MSARRGTPGGGIIGGWGPRARLTVERVARDSGLELIHEGQLAIAAPSGSLQSGRAGAHRVWLTGRMAVGERATPSPGASMADAVAASFDQLGELTLSRLYGAYLIVALDQAQNIARVSHDHIGARTLNYAQRGRDTFFAEHIVDLLALLPHTPPPDRLAVVQWIDRRTLPVGRSLFSGVARLPGGHALEMSETAVTVRRFWAPAYREPAQSPRDQCSAAVVTAAFAAVSRTADGLQQPAVKLSGGLDSACVAAGLSATSPRRALAFARTFPDYPGTDETDLLEQTARTTGLSLVALPYTDTAMYDSVAGYIRRWAVPPGSPNGAIWQPLMAAARAHGVDGLLDGEGGDELFGLSPYLIADRLRQGRLLGAWELAGRLPGLGPSPAVGDRLRAARIYGISGAVPRPWQRVRRRLRGPREGISQLVCDRDLGDLIAQDDPWAWKTGDGPLWWCSAVDGFLNGPERLDANGDLARDAVDAQLERRHPFVHDAQLIESMLAIPPEMQFDPVRDRPLLRDGLAGMVPEAVRSRYEKSYFNEVLTRPLTGPQGLRLLEQLGSPAAPIREYVRPEGLEALGAISTPESPRRHQLAGRLFRVASIDSWLRYLAEPAAEPAACAPAGDG